MPRVRIEREMRGRPDGYREDYVRQARVHAKLGATDEDLGELFEVSPRTIRRWISIHKEFAEAIHEGQMEAFNPRVVRSLAQRAIGYVTEASESKVLRDGSIITYPIKKVYPPDVTACIFWLKNRMPTEWRDVQDHILQHQNLDKLTSKEILDDIRKEAAQLGISFSLPKTPRPTADGGHSRH